MNTSVEGAYIQPAFAAVVEIELAPVAGGVSLLVMIKSPFLCADDKRIARVIKFHTLPAVTIVVFIEHEPAFLPLPLPEDQGHCGVTGGII